jgi:hypothetical protein
MQGVLKFKRKLWRQTVKVLFLIEHIPVATYSSWRGKVSGSYTKLHRDSVVVIFLHICRNTEQTQVRNTGVSMQNFSCVTCKTYDCWNYPWCACTMQKKLVSFTTFISLMQIVTDVAFVNMQVHRSSLEFLWLAIRENQVAEKKHERDFISIPNYHLQRLTFSRMNTARFKIDTSILIFSLRVVQPCESQCT